MEKIIILCFSTGEVFVRNYPKGLENSEEWFGTEHNDVGLKEQDCQWMISKELKINIA